MNLEYIYRIYVSYVTLVTNRKVSGSSPDEVIEFFSMYVLLTVSLCL
jgi:hypothetical protein